MNKSALITIDVEDWFHLDYIQNKKYNSHETCLDGLYYFIDFLKKKNIKGNFFFLDDILQQIPEVAKKLCEEGHGIGSHGKSHVRPLIMEKKEFENEMKRCFENLTSILNCPNKKIGYRAPCFSLNDKLLTIIKKIGFTYDSSFINFKSHPLYGEIKLEKFVNYADGIKKEENFYEFEVSTINIFKKNLPISGGGYLRIFPWWFFKSLLIKYSKKNSLYNFFIHPYELSKNNPNISSLSLKEKVRFNLNRNKGRKKLNNLIDLLIDKEFEFLTFDDLIENK